ncbi:MAG: hypothetical protein GC145_08545 [Caulobacter sp.]|nr:hypothetical protein [Caulobacter sp.]
MRTHSDIIAAAGGASRLARALKAPPNRAHQWKRLDSIPPRYWPTIAARGLASLEELAVAAARRAASQRPDPR